jgi:hypothetical protein
MGEIIGEMLVFAILNFIGGTVRWCFAILWNVIFNTQKHSFKEYIYSSDENTLLYDGANGCLNTVIGIAFVALILFVIFSI